MTRVGRVATVVLLAFGAAGGATEDADLTAALARVSGSAVRAHVEFLADDLLEGRDTGSRGHEIAARYVATQLALMGVKPAGESGTFFQAVPLVESRLLEGALSLRGKAQATLAIREDFIMTGDPLRTESRVEAPVVFAGFGVTAPTLHHDDYRGLDVTGKIVALLSDAPARFPSEERAYHASRTRKAENAAQHGAVGVLTFRSPEEEARAPWARMLGYTEGPTVRWTHPDGTPEGVWPGLRGSALLSADGARKLFAGSPVPIETVFARAERGSLEGFPLGVTAALSTRSELRRLQSPNVVGRLEGSDPALRSTHVVYSAHLDHIGIQTPENGDRICNGAYDNALGSAIVLEAARALAGLEHGPRRSLLFLFVTGEEKGLVGSDYFASHPTVPAASLVADVNVDMPLVLFPIADVVAYGAENSTLSGPATAAATSVGLALSPDPMPEETIFVRSDQYSFVRKGVPSVYFAPGMRSADPAVDGAKLLREFLRDHYHRPSDDLRLPMDLSAIARYTKANVALGYAIAQDEAAPRWKSGNFFGETFASGKD